MNITVVLCTYNRCDSLAKTLASIAASSFREPVEWEVLVVDNNSTDKTREVTEDFCRQFPGRFRYSFEANPGKSFALNRGIREARGDLLAFTDDDVIADQAWLENLTMPLKKSDWAGIGGRILPAERVSPPNWLPLNGPDSMGAALYAHFDLGEKPLQLAGPPYGANVAFRKSVFEKYGFFRTDLGPSPNKRNPRNGDDCEFGRRLWTGGEGLMYEPSAVVYHRVFKDRIRKDYILAWKYDAGRADVLECGPGSDMFGFRRPIFTAAKMVGAVLPKRICQWMVAFHPQQRFVRKCKLWETAGRFVETCRLIRVRPGPNG